MPFRGLYTYPLEFCMFVDMLSSAEPTIHRSPIIYICVLDVETATMLRDLGTAEDGLRRRKRITAIPISAVWLCTEINIREVSRNQRK